MGLKLLCWTWYKNRLTVRGERRTVSLAWPKKQVCWEDLREKRSQEISRGRRNAGFKMGRDEMGAWEFGLYCFAVRYRSVVNSSEQGGHFGFRMLEHISFWGWTLLHGVTSRWNRAASGYRWVRAHCPFPPLLIHSLTAHTRPLFPTPFTFPPSLRSPYTYVKNTPAHFVCQFCVRQNISCVLSTLVRCTVPLCLWNRCKYSHVLSFTWTCGGHRAPLLICLTFCFLGIFETWWHTRRNQFWSFREMDESI